MSRVERYDKEQHEEYQYTELIREVLEFGYSSKGRGGAYTRSLFGKTMEFSLDFDNRIPLFTTKKVFFRGVVEELLWILRGDTNAKHLSSKNIHIWDGHTSREFLDSRGLQHYPEGDIGPLYGFQLRHFGADYKTCNDDYAGQGVDQLKNLIDGLREDPRSRRHVVSMWNPVDLNKMCLTPCHSFFQMYVDDNGLSCLLYQRSADLGLGVPFNVASYSILTRIIAKCLDMPAYKFIHQIGDAHIYEDHVGKIEEHFGRVPYEFPSLTINKDIKTVEDIENLRFEDFVLEDYKFHKSIKMNLVV